MNQSKTLTRSCETLLRSSGYTVEGSDGVSPSSTTPSEAGTTSTYDPAGRLAPVANVTDGGTKEYFVRRQQCNRDLPDKVNVTTLFRSTRA